MMDSPTDDVLVASAAYVILSGGYVLLKKKLRRKRRWWMLSINKSRSRYSGTNMLADLTNEPSGRFENFCRMSATDFEIILNKVGPHIRKQDTVFRKAIPANERLAVTLRFLATGDNFASLSYLFKISNQTISCIVHEVCNALIHELGKEIKIPGNQQEWKNVAEIYKNVWNFPQCVGAIDGKHIILQSPMNSGSEFINYKGSFSIVLMGLVDANYCFLFADIGSQGRISDGGVFQNCDLFNLINNEKLKLPPDEPLPSSTTPVPYVIVADDAFPLSRNIMKPFAGTYDKGSKERAFNYRLSRARRVVENAFGIMASVFRVFRKPMLLQPEKATNVAMACILLHNFLRKSETSSSKYTPQGTFDAEIEGELLEGSWRRDQEQINSMLPIQKKPRKSSEVAKKLEKNLQLIFQM